MSTHAFHPTRWSLVARATPSFFAELLRNHKFAMVDTESGKLRTFLLSIGANGNND
jgi:hypothetical protein